VKAVFGRRQARKCIINKFMTARIVRMNMRHVLIAAALVGLVLQSEGRAGEQPSDVPKPVPATRPEIKAALESLKERTPRLPLPESDGQGSVNNGRMRATYLPETWAGGGRGNWSANRQRQDGRRESRGRFGQDPNSAFDYPFTTSLFWVVSRGNNCHYCLGHQELKLRGAGMDDDAIASLDSDWSRFDPRKQAALAYARRLTLEPQLIGDEDIAALKRHFSDAEIVELTFHIARFNSTNRWTDGMGLPQDDRFGEEQSSLLTPTSEAFHHTQSIVAPQTRTSRLPLPSHDEVKQALAKCSQRAPRVELPSEEIAETALASAIDNRPPLIWERALAHLAVAGPAQVKTVNTIMNDEHLTARLKSELALISAIHNRAWYAASLAIHRLHDLGVSAEEMIGLFDSPSGKPGATEAHRLAAKLTADPHLITDADIARVRGSFNDAETAQIVHVICTANMFDRFTEALGLPCDAER
jgi:alkylhydroperoxidase family enzyme